MLVLERTALTLLRVCIGWYFFWAGLTKLLDPDWSASSFLLHATMFPDFYAMFASPHILPAIDFLNAWGLTLAGVALLLGVAMRFSAGVGILLMLLYYFPHSNTHSFIVDEHLVMASALLVLAATEESRAYGLFSWCMKQKYIARPQLIRKFLS